MLDTVSYAETVKIRVSAAVSKEYERRIDEKTYNETEKTALDAYKALGCRGMSRVDIIINEENIPYVIEVNTVPGMTSMSLFPDSARYAGMEFPELLDTIVKLALEK